MDTTGLHDLAITWPDNVRFFMCSVFILGRLGMIHHRHALILFPTFRAMIGSQNERTLEIGFRFLDPLG